MKRIPFFQTDAFTTTPFKGNPAAICLVDEPLDQHTMQALALEMNLSETAFPEPVGPDGTRRLRWFTPTTEVPLCGHATLAAAAVLFAQGEPTPVRFTTLSGILTVHRENDGAIRMDFPADPPRPTPAPAGLLEALGCRKDTPTHAGTKIWVVEVDSEAEVAALSPDFTALRRVDVGGVMGVSVTAPGRDVDFVSRGFFPWSGVDEDPVTGSAHTTLTPYWAGRTGLEEMTARQISARGGELVVRLVDDRVHLVGRTVTVAEGTLFVPGTDRSAG